MDDEDGTLRAVPAGRRAGGARELFSLLDMVIAGASCGTQEAIGAMTDNAASGDEEESNGTIR